MLPSSLGSRACDRGAVGHRTADAIIVVIATVGVAPASGDPTIAADVRAASPLVA
jgi:hypothetical protein